VEQCDYKHKKAYFIPKKAFACLSSGSSEYTMFQHSFALAGSFEGELT
jgi:hypothetical protein